MRISEISRGALGVWAVAGLLAGCGRESAAPLSPLLTAPSCFDCALAAPESISGVGTVFALTTSGSQKVLYRFGGSGDGASPYAGLIEVNGTLYGTTESGGANGKGTVFAIAPSGTESVLHSFGGSGDGSNPVASLVNVKGTLYGTTEYGGAYGSGTVFSITPPGTETVIHSFKSYPNDGANPSADLLDVKGMLYGTTQFGGSGDCEDSSQIYGCGSVFKITTAGAEKVLYNFDGFHGWRPYAGLINVSGTLYGTTVWLPEGYGAGAVFTITTSGKETELYAFQGGSDGAYPYSGLTNVNGTLYGTTYYGGENCGSNGCGTVFSITPSGTETALYRFKGFPRDGKHPYAGLINVNGTLYGTTYAGGATGRGTAFAITTSGGEKVIRNFGRGARGGKYPYAGLLYLKGVLYGTTQYGGAN